MGRGARDSAEVLTGRVLPAARRGLDVGLWLVGVLLLHSALRPAPSAAQEEPVPAVVPSAMALERLEKDGTPGGELDSLVRLDLMYLVAADHEEWVDSLQAAVDSRLELSRAQGSDSTITTGYLGALEVLRAKHGTWPPSRIKWVRRGVGRLDELVEQNPTDPHLRYLLTVSTLFLPGFMARGDEARADLETLAELLVAAGDGPSSNGAASDGADGADGPIGALGPVHPVPPEIRQRAAAFVLEYGDWLSADLLEQVAAEQGGSEAPRRSAGGSR